jgi:putative ABC transport system permease protein
LTPEQRLALSPVERERRQRDPASYALNDLPHAVIGVAADVRMQNELDAGPQPYVYFDYRQVANVSGDRMRLRAVGPNRFIIRSSDGSDTLIQAAKMRLLAIDPEITFVEIVRLEDRIARVIGGAGSAKLMRVLSLVFGVLSLLLAASGIYSVTAQVVNQRSYEIGLRMSLGASRVDIFRMTLMQGVRLTVCGLVIGLIGAWIATRVISALLFRTSATDPVVFTLMAFVLVVIGIVASVIPGIHASRVDPTIAMRNE